MNGECNDGGVVDLSEKKWTLNSAEDACKVIDEMRRVGHFHTFIFSSCSLGIEAAEVIGDELAKHSEFVNAHWSNLFVGRTAKEIPVALELLMRGVIKSGASIEELDLSHNAMGPSSIPGLQKFFRSAACYGLKSLKFSNTGQGPHGSKTLAEFLDGAYENSNAAGNPMRLTEFVCDRSRVEDDGIEQLSQVFIKMRSLEVLDLGQDGIRLSGFQTLRGVFVNSTGLRELHLRDNLPAREGGNCLAHALPVLSNLEWLDIADCLLSSSLVKIGDTLRLHCPFLAHLDVSFNDASFRDLFAIIEAMQYKSYLNYISVAGNRLSDDEILILSNSLEDFGLIDCLGEVEDCEDDELDDRSFVEDLEEDEQVVDDGGAVPPPPPLLEIDGELFRNYSMAAILEKRQTTGYHRFISLQDFASFNNLMIEMSEIVTFLEQSVSAADDALLVIVLMAQLVEAAELEQDEAILFCDRFMTMCIEWLKAGPNHETLLAEAFLSHAGLLKSERNLNKVEPLCNEIAIFFLQRILDVHFRSNSILMNKIDNFLNSELGRHRKIKWQFLVYLNHFVKSFGWGWVFVLAMGFVFFTTRYYDLTENGGSTVRLPFMWLAKQVVVWFCKVFCLNRCVYMRPEFGLILSFGQLWGFLRIIISTFLWYLITKTFVTIQSTGECKTVHGEPRPLLNKFDCYKSNHSWSMPDISGHVFLLIWANLTLLEEMSVLKLLDRLQSASNRGNRVIINILTLLIAVTVLLYDVLLVVTAIYYHTVVEKMVALLVVSVIWVGLYKGAYPALGIGPGSLKSFDMSQIRK